MAGSEEDSAVNEECYDMLKEDSACVIDFLASNDAAITPFSNELFSKGVIPKPVHVAVLNTALSPYERATKLINSVLATLKFCPNPRGVLEFFMDSTSSVNSCIKREDDGKDMHDMIIQLPYTLKISWCFNFRYFRAHFKSTKFKFHFDSILNHKTTPHTNICTHEF